MGGTHPEVEVGGTATLQQSEVDMPPQGTLRSEEDTQDLRREMEASQELPIQGVASLDRVEGKPGTLGRRQGQGKEEGALQLD